MVKHLFFLIAIFHYCSIFALQINVICPLNGSGLERDFRILEKELTALGHSVSHVSPNIKKVLSPVDVNIFIESFIEQLFSCAKKNIFIPNPEWFVGKKEILPQFDLILCRTREAERIFLPFNKNTTYLGFTSLDRFKEEIPKNFRLFVHLAGGSLQKGTKTLFEVWSHHPDYPLLTCVCRNYNDPKIENLLFTRTRLQEIELECLQNQCGIHLCTSETEGYGHYLWEAMSCGAVVITTDASPMNEFISDERCLVKFHKMHPQRLATNYYIDPSSLESTIDAILAIPQEELESMGRKNRQIFLHEREAFRTRLKKIFGKTESN